MFDELAQNDEDAEDYDLESLERHTDARSMLDNDDDAATLVNHRMAQDEVVFEIGDGDEDIHDLSDDDERTNTKKRRTGSHDGEAHEREGLMKDD